MSDITNEPAEAKLVDIAGDSNAKSGLPETGLNVREEMVSAFLAQVSTTLFVHGGIKPLDTRQVDFTQAVMRQSSPDTRFIMGEDVSLLDLKQPCQDNLNKTVL